MTHDAANDATNDATHDATHDDFGGLARDVSALLDRRGALRLLAGTGLVALAGCGSKTTTSTPSPTSSATSAATGSATTGTAGGAVEQIPSETAGPYPGDGSNGPDVLSQAGVVRSDIRKSFGDAPGMAEGVDLTVVLAMQDLSGAALSAAAVYLWHADREGRYSLYSPGVTQENYLRGLQPANPDGTVTFRTVWPGCYPGRYPHLHFEVYASVADAAGGKEPIATSQRALPAEPCRAVYATEGYSSSAQSFAGTSLTSDMVFGDDGGARQLATVTGSSGSGYSARLVVPVSAG
jgi:protocatechuate 3,4-dioxygenase beta subunit